VTAPPESRTASHHRNHTLNLKPKASKSPQASPTQQSHRSEIIGPDTQSETPINYSPVWKTNPTTEVTKSINLAKKQPMDPCGIIQSNTGRQSNTTPCEILSNHFPALSRTVPNPDLRNKTSWTVRSLRSKRTGKSVPATPSVEHSRQEPTKQTTEVNYSTSSLGENPDGTLSSRTDQTDHRSELFDQLPRGESRWNILVKNRPNRPPK
jgi:hypothetical protein